MRGLPFGNFSWMTMDEEAGAFLFFSFLSGFSSFITFVPQCIAYLFTTRFCFHGFSLSYFCFCFDQTIAFLLGLLFKWSL